MSVGVETYEDKKGEWRWRLKAGNGEIVATGESHTSETDAFRAFVTVADIISTNVVVLRRAEK